MLKEIASLKSITSPWWSSVYHVQDNIHLREVYGRGEESRLEIASAVFVSLAMTGEEAFLTMTV